MPRSMKMFFLNLYLKSRLFFENLFALYVLGVLHSSEGFDCSRKNFLKITQPSRETHGQSVNFGIKQLWKITSTVS